MTTQKLGSQVSSQVNESKLQRRHRIFDPVSNTSSSVSPNNAHSKVVSPISRLNSLHSPTNNVLGSKVINPLTKPKLA